MHNTDGAAIVGLLREATGGLVGRRVAVLGAGGAGRAAAHACAMEGAGVAIWSRGLDRAERAVRELRHAMGRERSGAVVSVTLEDVIRGRFDVVVHATPRGMNGDGALLTREELTGCAGGGVVMETVYSPARTALVERAEEAGCRVVDGLSVFVRQAEKQSELFTGIWPEVGVFEGLVRG